MSTQQKLLRLAPSCRHRSALSVPHSRPSRSLQKQPFEASDKKWKKLENELHVQPVLSKAFFMRRYTPSNPFTNHPFFASPTATSSLTQPAARYAYSTSTRQEPSKEQVQADSIFSPAHSPWDHVFDNIKELPPLLPSSTRSPKHRLANTAHHSEVKLRRQTMTAREISAFDEMFNMIFNAVSQHKSQGRIDPNAPDDIAIGLGPQVGSGTKRELSDLFGTLRRHSKRLKWTSSTDEELDRKKEEMELCDTDQQLLEWAMREVFGESRKYEEAARKAVEQVSRGEEVESMPMLQHPAYPYLISGLMSRFRDRYRDPHLALSIFDYARHLSIPSFVFGCTAPAYNELIHTRWSCFRDLKGILDSLEEMKVNGVEPDNHTRGLVEKIRKEAGEKVVWHVDEDYHLGNGGGQVWDMLSRIEALVIKESSSMRKSPKLWRKKPLNPLNAWKNGSADEVDDWQFGKWDQDYSTNFN